MSCSNCDNCFCLLLSWPRPFFSLLSSPPFMMVVVLLYQSIYGLKLFSNVNATSPLHSSVERSLFRRPKYITKTGKETLVSLHTYRSHQEPKVFSKTGVWAQIFAILLGVIFVWLMYPRYDDGRSRYCTRAVQCVHSTNYQMFYMCVLPVLTVVSTLQLRLRSIQF